MVGLNVGGSVSAKGKKGAYVGSGDGPVGLVVDGAAVGTKVGALVCMVGLAEGRPDGLLVG